MNPFYTAEWHNFWFHFVYYIGPVFFSLILRYIYKKYLVHLISPIYIVFLVALLSVTCGMLWLCEQFLLEKIFFGQFTFNVIDMTVVRSIWYKSYPFVMWSIIYLALKVNEEFAIQKRNAERAQLFAKSAQLEMLRYQLNPHFLFNTLSSLRALIRNNENKVAEDMVTQISEFLKYSLLEGENSKVTISKEIRTIQHYFEIEKVRFKEQLYVEFRIDPLSENYLIPVFLIHPLVENAVKHGMKTSQSPLKIQIKTEISKSNLKIEIINSGRWIEREAQNDITRTGLQNTRKRLELAYPNNHDFDIRKEENSVCITIVINTNVIDNEKAD